MQDDFYMQIAINEAKKAALINEVPVGAVIVYQDEIIAKSHNQNILLHNPCAHAEVLALAEAGRKLANYRLLDTEIFVTLEPCAMCTMALIHARVKRLIFGASDTKTGACGGCFDLIADEHHNHRILVTSNIKADESSQLLKNFFKAKRDKSYK